jgi:hypothetical protein
VNVDDAVSSTTFFKVVVPDSIDVGDANGDGAVNVGDAVYIIDFIFKGGPELVCP